MCYVPNLPQLKKDLFIVQDALMVFSSLICAYLDFDVLLVKNLWISSPIAPSSFVVYAMNAYLVVLWVP